MCFTLSLVLLGLCLSMVQCVIMLEGTNYGTVCDHAAGYYGIVCDHAAGY
jgi:hypothetical protein